MNIYCINQPVSYKFILIFNEQESVGFYKNARRFANLIYIIIILHNII